MEEILKRIERQNSAIIRILGRMAFSGDEILKIVTNKKRNPKGYIRAYNAIDGEEGVGDLAKIAGVNQSNMSRALQEWQSKNIVFDLGDSKKSKFMRLSKI